MPLTVLLADFGEGAIFYGTKTIHERLFLL